MYPRQFRPSPFDRPLLTLSVAATIALAPLSGQSPVDLVSWSPENYPAVGGFSNGQWTVAANNLSVNQSVNGQPTLFFSDFNALMTVVEGQITTGFGDDDFVGFAIGFEPGDATNTAADYLLVDWKQGTQPFNFSAPSCSVGGTAQAGLAVSRVTGIPSADEFWQHNDTDDTCSPLGQGLTELQRGATLGATGWSDNVTYTFRFEFLGSRLRVFVDGSLELDVVGSFGDGRFAFYNFSQSDVTYAAFTQAAAASKEVYGSPCSVGTPLMLDGSLPILGTTCTLQGSGVDPASPTAVFIFGDMRIDPGFGLAGVGASGCFAHINGNLGDFPAAVVGGNATYDLSIPADPALSGAVFYAQLVAASAATPLGLVTSNGFAGTLGL
jgi:hypothetical protein